jgi:cytochrome P450
MDDQDLLGRGLTDRPHERWAWLREWDPVSWDESQKAWLVTRYDDVLLGLADPGLSSDRINPLIELLPPERRAALAPMLSVMRDWMVVTDPPAHTRLRHLANAAFRQQRIATMKTWIGEIVDDLIDEFVRRGGTDFVTGVAYPMPATVIARMLGAPATDRDLFQKWSDELALVAFGAGGDARRDRHQRALRGVGELQDYLRDLIGRLRRDPGDDMISSLLAEAGGLSEQELLSLCSLILFAGHETTTNLLCNAVVALSAYPDQVELLRENPDLTASAVEEVLRHEGPIKILVRWVAEGMTLRGQHIRAGDRVYLVLQSANRDGAVFDEPDRFDIRRPTQPAHVAFGRGAHACLGAQLARLEARVALPKILERLPGLRVAGEVGWKPNIASRAVNALAVEYDGRRVEAKGS